MIITFLSTTSSTCSASSFSLFTVSLNLFFQEEKYIYSSSQLSSPIFLLTSYKSSHPKVYYSNLVLSLVTTDLCTSNRLTIIAFMSNFNFIFFLAYVYITLTISLKASTFLFSFSSISHALNSSCSTWSQPLQSLLMNREHYVHN